METKNNCDCSCNCDLSKVNMDMTVRECLEKFGLDPEKVQKNLKDCCKDCCGK